MKEWKKALVEDPASDIVDTAVAGTKRKAVSRSRAYARDIYLIPGAERMCLSMKPSSGVFGRAVV